MTRSAIDAYRLQPTQIPHACNAMTIAARMQAGMMSMGRSMWVDCNSVRVSPRLSQDYALSRSGSDPEIQLIATGGHLPGQPVWSIRDHVCRSAPP